MEVVRIWDATPMTPEIKVDREAIGLVASLVSDGRPAARSPGRSANYPTIDDQVRKRALNLAAAQGRAEEARRPRPLCGSFSPRTCSETRSRSSSGRIPA